MSTAERARVRIGSIATGAEIDRKVYGHFLESAFFRNIEGGVFDEGSPLAVTGEGALDGCRADVIAACRELGLPVVRWPGGNFTSPYRWEDGIGPRDARPRRLELAWGSEESNRFGTPEFLAWCEAVGTEPYLAHSARDVDDAVRWVEYANYGGDTAYARARAADGHPEPHGVRIWGIGNEVYGPWQMGHRDARRYADDTLEHARFMSAVDPSLRFVAVGSEDPEWTTAVVERVGSRVEWISLHLYGASLHLTDPSRDEFDRVVAQSWYFERAIEEQSEDIARAAARAGIDRRLGIALDEWNIRHLEPESWPEPQPGDDGGIAPRDTTDASGPGRRVSRYSPRTLADALFTAGVFHAIRRSTSLDVSVTMANTVNLVNANGLLAVRPDGLVRAATFHVWDLYQNRTSDVAVPVEVHAPARFAPVRLGHDERPDGTFRTRTAGVPDLDVSVTRDAASRVLHVAVVNRSADRDIDAELEWADGELPPVATSRVLGADADDLFAVNTTAAPDAVATRGPERVEFGRTHRFPAHSITVLEFEIG